MNEKVKELVKQAWEQRDLISPNRALDDAFTDKFAELLIKECLTVITSIDKHQAYTTFDLGLIESTIQKTSNAVKQHFGV